MKSMNLIGFLVGGKRDFTVKLPNMRRASSKNANVLIVQPNPIRGRRFWTIIGSTTPPMLEPATMMPNARARCLLNQVPHAAIACDCQPKVKCETDKNAHLGRRENCIRWRCRRLARGRIDSTYRILTPSLIRKCAKPIPSKSAIVVRSHRRICQR